MAGEIGALAFGTFFILAVLDDLLPGFVSLYFSPGIFLAGALVAIVVWLGLTIMDFGDKV